MATNLGYSFSPTQAQADQAKAGATSPPFSQQGALKTLSFRLPRITGAGSSAAISPQVGQDLRGGGFSSAVLESVLRTLLGPGHADQILNLSPMSGGGGGGPDMGMATLAGLSSGVPGGPPGVTIHPGTEDEFPRSGNAVPMPAPDFTDRTPQQDFGGGMREPGGYAQFASNEAAMNDRTQASAGAPDFWRTNKYSGE